MVCVGMFHFGGSTHLLVFGPQVHLEFQLQGQTPGLHASNLPINSVLAVASAATPAVAEGVRKRDRHEQ